jgi:hypothetical protein
MYVVPAAGGRKNLLFSIFFTYMRYSFEFNGFQVLKMACNPINSGNKKILHTTVGNA